MEEMVAAQLAQISGRVIFTSNRTMKERHIYTSSAAIVTVMKMLETLHEPFQNQGMEHLRGCAAELVDEFPWDEQFRRTQSQLGTIGKP